ncbi:MAG: hypothetical protein JNJ57_04175 [Saprospiraceae bacterium]|nr:hypothetical protein [Saprospiraceae bacterium]
MRILSLCLFVLTVHLLSAQTSKSGNIVELKEAIQKKLISASITGLGGHQGESIKVVCKNLSGRYLRIRIPQGQLMAPADSAEQTLVVAEEYLVSLTTKTPAEALLKTFCTEAGDMSPSLNAAFAIGALAPEAVCKLLQFITEKGKVDAPQAQTAIWCLTSKNYSVAGIGDAELARFTADLKGVAMPGYKVTYKPVEEVPGRPAELGKALLVEGNFTFYLEKDEIARMVLLDGEQKLIKQLSKDETMKAGEHRSGMKLEVYNLDPGKYIVRLQTKAGRVIKDWPVEF